MLRFVRANLLILGFLLVLSSVMMSLISFQGDAPEPALSRTACAPGLSEELAEKAPDIHAFSINRISLGMTRKQVEKLFPPRRAVGGEAEPGFYESFGTSICFDQAYENWTGVHFDESDIVTGVTGVNLDYRGTPVVRATWGERKRGYSKEKLHEVLGESERTLQERETKRLIYTEPDLEIVARAKFPWVIRLGDRPD